MTKEAYHLQTKAHFTQLDALRGVAALVVVLYHTFECFDQSLSPAPHGYLAVDFFFVLSGFVIGYAYDDRWSRGLSTRHFFKRRLIRLHPMVVLGAVLGMITFLAAGSTRWDGTEVGFPWVMLALVLGMLMIPVPVGCGADVRGNGEMFPLNGPTWSLFFEYIGNILYSLLLRRLPTRWLLMLTLLLGAGLSTIAIRDGALGVGWTLAEGGFWGGLVRMLFPYCMGMLMARLHSRMPSCTAAARPLLMGFLLPALLIVAVAIVPLAEADAPAWHNGLFEAACIIFLFPSIVWFSARFGNTESTAPMRFLGNLSYPLYAVHYPFMYLFYIPIIGGSVTHIQQVWPAALLTVGASLLVAWLAMRYYDRPLRKWLMKRWG